MQLSLNCFIMFEIFSNLCTSSWFTASWWVITKKVLRSNKTASLAPIVEQNCWRLSSSYLIFGSRMLTICDQALYRVSSQMLVLNTSVLWSKSLPASSNILLRFSWKTDSRWASYSKSILWIKQKILAFWDSSRSASRHVSKRSMSPLKSFEVTSKTKMRTSTSLKIWSRCD